MIRMIGHSQSNENVDPPSSPEFKDAMHSETISFTGSRIKSLRIAGNGSKNKYQQRVDHTYRDFSRYKGDPSKANEFDQGKKLGSNFPAKLHQILSDDRYQHVICWMPHGRSWKILDRDLLVTEVCAKYFSHSTFTSFTRQVNGWGFKRLHQSGPDCKSYYHECFLRGLPRLTRLMRRLSSNRGKFLPCREHEPNFFDISLEYPLPPSSGEPLEAEKTRTFVDGAMEDGSQIEPYPLEPSGMPAAPNLPPANNEPNTQLSRSVQPHEMSGNYYPGYQAFSYYDYSRPPHAPMTHPINDQLPNQDSISYRPHYTPGTFYHNQPACYGPANATMPYPPPGYHPQRDEYHQAVSFPCTYSNEPNFQVAGHAEGSGQNLSQNVVPPHFVQPFCESGNAGTPHQPFREYSTGSYLASSNPTERSFSPPSATGQSSCTVPYTGLHHCPPPSSFCPINSRPHVHQNCSTHP